MKEDDIKVRRRRRRDEDGQLVDFSDADDGEVEMPPIGDPAVAQKVSRPCSRVCRSFCLPLPPRARGGWEQRNACSVCNACSGGNACSGCNVCNVWVLLRVRRCRRWSSRA